MSGQTGEFPVNREVFGRSNGIPMAWRGLKPHVERLCLEKFRTREYGPGPPRIRERVGLLWLDHHRRKVGTFYGWGRVSGTPAEGKNFENGRLFPSAGDACWRKLAQGKKKPADIDAGR